MSEPLLTDQIVGVDGALNVFLVNSKGNPHDHVLRPFHDLTVHLEQVSFLECLEPEQIVVPITLVVDCVVKFFLILLDHFVDVLRDEACIFAIYAFVRIQLFNYITKLFLCSLVEGSNSDPSGQPAVIWVKLVEVGGRLSDQVVKIGCFYALILVKILK